MIKTLTDVQNLKDNRGIDIQKVGVKNVEVPLNIQRKNDTEQIVSARATMSVALPADFKGTHMSRFIQILTDWGQKNLLGADIRGCLTDVCDKLHAHSAEVKFEFKYFMNKKAPLSGLTCPMGYDCSFEGQLDLEKNSYSFILGVKVPVTTVCPCSKEISEYGAHNQRAIVTVRISYNEESIIWLEDLVAIIEQCGSCPVFPILKREDEKYVTEAAYNNPKFVEDVLRDTVSSLKAIPQIEWYEVECEAFESIHNHSAWAYQEEFVNK